MTSDLIKTGKNLKDNFRFLLAATLLFLILPASNISAQPADIEKKLKGLDQKIEKILKDWNVPGCGIGIIVKDKLVYAKGYGYRNIEKKLPVTPNTLFQIASNTKLFTATAAGFLVDEGKLDWDLPIKKYVPQIQFYNDELNASVTIRDMLSHRTGISRHDNIWHNSDFTRQQLFERLKYLEPSIPLRTGYLYNNLMYAATGQIVEIISGKRWEEFVQERIFNPLNMSNSLFVVDEMLRKEDFMNPYYEKRDTTILLPSPFYTKQEGLGPAGAIISNINDLTNWVVTQLYGGMFNGKQVIPASVIKETMQPAIPASSVPVKGQMENLNSIYGMGRNTSSYKGHYRAQHGGAIGGIYSNIAIFPADSIGIIVFTNRLTNLPGIISNVIIDQLLGLYETNWSERGLTNYLKNKETQQESRKKPDADRVPGTKPSHPLADYTGIFEDPAYGVLEITLKDENLQFRYNNTSLPLNHYHYDRFVSPDDEIEGKWSLLFSMDAQGSINKVSISMDEAAVEFTRRADKKLSDPALLRKFEGQYDLNGTIISIVFRNNELIAATAPPQHLVPYKNSIFSIREFPDQTVEFLFDEKGETKGFKLTADGNTLIFIRKK